MDNFYLYLGVPFAITLLCTPVIRKLAYVNGIVDHPGGRKIHKVAKPLLGGVGLYLAIVATILLFYPLDIPLAGLLLGMTIIVIVGILDDLYDINAYAKLFGQLAAASVFVIFNINSFALLMDFFYRHNIPEFVGLVLIIGWIALMINSFNLIDGVDGLATGTSAIICLFLILISLIKLNYFNLGLQMVLLGACLGFLPYNFQPARIYLGDMGSMLLGFSLSTIFLYTISTPFSFVLVTGSIFIFIYPVMDIVFAILRRLWNRSPLFGADRGHIHHLLLDLGFPVRKVVLLLYMMSFVAGISGVALLSLVMTPLPALLIMIVVITGIFFFFTRLGLLHVGRQASKTTSRRSNI